MLCSSEALKRRLVGYSCGSHAQRDDLDRATSVRVAISLAVRLVKSRSNLNGSTRRRSRTTGRRSAWPTDLASFILPAQSLRLEGRSRFALKLSKPRSIASGPRPRLSSSQCASNLSPHRPTTRPSAESVPGERGMTTRGILSAVGKLAHVQAARAAEAHKRKQSRVVSSLDRNDAERPLHIRIRNSDDAERGGFDRHAAGAEARHLFGKPR